MKVEAVIPAAGLGLRIGGSTPKPLLRIGGRPILAHTLDALADSGIISRAIIAVNKEHVGAYKKALNNLGYRDSTECIHSLVRSKKALIKQVDLVLGGSSRADSVSNCLDRVFFDTDIILVHDAVRPFIEPKLIKALADEAGKCGAAICGVPVKATIKKVAFSSHLKSGQGCLGKDIVVERTVDRGNLWEIQTPQAFRRGLLLEAYKQLGDKGATDEATLVERLGFKVKVLESSYFNIKITTFEDLVFAEAILKNRRHDS